MKTPPPSSVSLVCSALFLLTLTGCRRNTSLVETGLLLRFENAADAPLPTEVRLDVYDGSGRLFADERLPRNGRLTPTGLPELGTLMLYPGQTAGALRIHARGLQEGQRVSEGVVRMVGLVAGRVVEATLVLAPSRLPDGDGDGVPDVIDNCALPNREQGPCGGSPPGDAGGEGPAPGDAGVEDTGAPADGPEGDGAPADGPGAEVGPDTTPAPDQGPGLRANGQACVAGSQCSSGFCADGVCCDLACDGRCQTCSRMPGSCVPIAAGSDPDQECGTFTCNGQGACYAACDMTCGPQCAASAHCRNGQCVRDLGPGSGCSSDCQCASGRCRATLLSETCE